jgi:hypothetical protein
MNNLNGWQSLGFKSYHEFLQSDLWKEKRKYILSLRPICENCRVNKSTEVHHTDYAWVGNEKGCDLKALCYGCHRKVHHK